ncbi:hypothetical protein DNC80_07755 [Flavobacterium sp. SOK18b]|uniref:thrombospondin type-1 domain-containing protein n=1 Tax=Flavobacterium sp. SOK18b TaxID=797900 RepID=UPI0015FC4600|nr:thrombospondin type-1 domain-containing protein [Flavobacterium sp. SOK18b]MBB1193563.1 hypothetical protein [Flavobacterium sp. SOK18b]
MIAVGIQEEKKDFNSDIQNNFSKVIKVYSSDLSGNGSLEEQICEYVNSLNYIKMDTDADVWIEYNEVEDHTPLPVNAIVSNWTDWSVCSVDGFQSRTRYVITPASGGGTTPVLSETRECTPIIVPPTPVDAVVSDWTDWSVCSVDGFQSRTRYVITPASGRGTTPVLSETRECTPIIVPPTPVDAVVSNWTDWSACSVDGFQSRTRYVITPASDGGTTPVLSETRECTPIIVPPTPVDAVVSDWEGWSPCSVDGYTTRTRYVITPASNGGGTPILTQTEECEYVNRVQQTTYFDDPCGLLIPNLWLDTTANIYYTSEFGSEVYSGNLHTFMTNSNSGFDEYEWQFIEVLNGVTDGIATTLFSSCPPNYGGLNKVGAIINFDNDIMTFQVHPEVANRQFTCGGYSGLALEYMKPGESVFTVAYFNGTMTAANLIYLELPVGTLLKLIDTIGDLLDSDVYTITNGVPGGARLQISNKFESPCGNVVTAWVDPLTNFHYTTEFGTTFFNGNIYDFEGQADQVGLEFNWSYIYVENGVVIPSGSGSTISSCNPYN